MICYGGSSDEKKVNILAIVLPIVIILVVGGLIGFLVYWFCYRKGGKRMANDGNSTGGFYMQEMLFRV